MDKLEESKSGGRSDDQIKLDDGRKFVGKLKFGEARLKDYQKATGTSFSQYNRLLKYKITYSINRFREGQKLAAVRLLRYCTHTYFLLGWSS